VTAIDLPSPGAKCPESTGKTSRAVGKRSGVGADDPVALRTLVRDSNFAFELVILPDVAQPVCEAGILSIPPAASPGERNQQVELWSTRVAPVEGLVDSFAAQVADDLFC
jgi:hypothetical protein